MAVILSSWSTRLLFGVLIGTASAAPPTNLDAYIYTRYFETGQNALPQNEPAAMKYCDDCDNASTNPGCVPLNNLRIEQQCLKWTRRKDEATVLGMTYDANATHFCSNRYADPVCTLSFPQKCHGALPLNTCDANSGLTTQELKDWCIVSKGGQPIGNYTVPILKYQIYDAMEKCTTGIGVKENVLAMDKNHCKPFISSVNGKIVSGSIRTYCDPKSTSLVRDIYSDPNCMEQSSELDIIHEAIPDFQCTETLNFAAAAKMYMKASCSTLTDPTQEVIYCKPLYQAGFGSFMSPTFEGQKNEPNSEEEAHSQARPKDCSSSWTVMVSLVGMVLSILQF